jgi:DNA-binding MarR family transcriptional regulator
MLNYGEMLMNSSKTELVVHLFVRVINRYIATEKRPCDYGIGCLLYRSELHTIDAIGKHNQINITDLSNYLGVTKSAVSQMIDRLIKKELVNKTVLSKSDTEVALTLTPKGEKAYFGHSEYHQKLYQYVEQMLGTVSESDINIFTGIMNQLDTFLNEER